MSTSCKEENLAGELIAHTANCDNSLGDIGIHFNSSSKPTNVNIDRATGNVRISSPNSVQEGFAGEHLTGVSGKEEEERELLR